MSEFPWEVIENIDFFEVSRKTGEIRINDGYTYFDAREIGGLFYTLEEAIHCAEYLNCLVQMGDENPQEGAIYGIDIGQ